MDSGLEVNRWVAVELETQERNSEGVDIISTHERPPEWLAEQPCHIRGDNSLKKGSVRGCNWETGNPAAMLMRGISEVIITEVSEG